DETNTLLQAAQRHFDQGRLIEAAASCRQALTREPRCWEALALLGATLFQQGDAAAARELLTRSVDDDGGECPQLYITLAEVLAAGGEADQAIRRLRDALLLQPTSAALHNELGVLLARQQRAALEHALRVVPSDWRLLHRCAIPLMKTAPAEAERYLRLALLIHPSAAPLWDALAQCQALESAAPSRADPAHSKTLIQPPDG